MIAAYLPLVLLVLILLFYKKCLKFIAWDDTERIIPRLVVWGSILLSLIPFAGYMMCFLIGLIYPMSAQEVRLKDNKFTSFWLRK